MKIVPITARSTSRMNDIASFFLLATVESAVSVPHGPRVVNYSKRRPQPVSAVPAPAGELVDLRLLVGRELARGVPPPHLGDPASEREALAHGEALVDRRLPAGPQVVAHVPDACLEEEVDLDPAAIDMAHRELVDVAPHPVLSGLQRLDHRMAGLPMVPRRVMEGARIAAPDVPARQAQPEAHPAALASADAVLAHRLRDRPPVDTDL